MKWKCGRVAEGKAFAQPANGRRAEVRPRREAPPRSAAERRSGEGDGHAGMPWVPGQDPGLATIALTSGDDGRQLMKSYALMPSEIYELPPSRIRCRRVSCSPPEPRPKRRPS